MKKMKQSLVSLDNTYYQHKSSVMTRYYENIEASLTDNNVAKHKILSENKDNFCLLGQCEKKPPYHCINCDDFAIAKQKT